MAEQSFEAKKGLRSRVLGSNGDLAIAAALADGDTDPAAHTDAGRLGYWFDRTAGEEGIVNTILGTDRFKASTVGANILDGGLLIASRADLTALTDLPSGPGSGFGFLWVRDSDKALVYRDEDDNDIVAASPGGGISIDGSGATDQVAVWVDSDTLEGDANLTYVAGTGLTVGDTTVSTDATTGALVTGGGLGVGGVIRAAGGTISAADSATEDTILQVDGSGGWVEFIQGSTTYSVGHHAQAGISVWQGTTGGTPLTRTDATAHRSSLSFWFVEQDAGLADAQFKFQPVSDPGAFVHPTADTDGVDTYLRAQGGSAHSANDPRGGDIVAIPGAAGSGGAGRDGIFDIQGDTSVTGTTSLTGNTDITGTLDTTDDLTVGNDTDRTTILGRTLIDSRVSDRSYISHVDMSASDEFALLQLASGQTILNAASGQSLLLQVGNNSIVGITSTSVNLSSGTTLQHDSNVVLDASRNLTVTDATVNGDLTVNGTVVTHNTDNLVVEDPLIKLANGNTSDTLDVGLYAEYDTGTTAKYAGLFRDADDGGRFKLFVDSETEPTTTVNTGATGYTPAELVLGTLSVVASGVQDVIFTAQSNDLLVQGGTTTTDFLVELASQDNNNTDDVALLIDNTGTSGSPDTEALFVGWDSGNLQYEIRNQTLGSGLTRPISLFTEGNSGQLVLDTAGDISMSGNLSAIALNMAEQAADPVGTPAGTGTIWVRNDSPSVLVFTNDSGTDLVIGEGLGQLRLLGTGTDNLATSNLGAMSAVVTGMANNIAIGRDALNAANDAAADSNIAIGTDALGNMTSGVNNTAIGQLSLENITTEIGNTGVGRSAGRTATGTRHTFVGNRSDGAAGTDDCTAIGENAQAIGNVSTAVGSGAIAGTGFAAVAVGVGSDASGNWSIAIGRSAFAVADSVAVGGGANAADSSSICLGRNAVSTASNQFVIGSAGSPPIETFFGPVTATTPTSQVRLNTSGGSGTDVGGTDFVIAGGKSTGAGLGGDVLIQTTPSGVSGSSPNSLTTRITVDADSGDTTFSSTTASTASTNGALIVGGGGGFGANTFIDGILGLEDGSERVVISQNATLGGTGAVAIGHGVTATGNEAVAIGSDASATFKNGVAIGRDASSSADSVVIGADANGSGNDGIAIGTGADCQHQSYVIGRAAHATGGQQFVVGDDNNGRDVRDVYIGGGVVTSNPNDVTYHGTGGSGTDDRGAHVTIAGGLNTGAGTPGEVRIQTGSVGGSGTSPSSLVTRMTFTETLATVATNAQLDQGVIYAGVQTVTGAGGTPDATADGTDTVFYLDGSSNTATLDLDAAPTEGQTYYVKSVDSTNTVTIGRNGNNIDGAASDITLATNESATLHFTTTHGWRIL